MEATPEGLVRARADDVIGAVPQGEGRGSHRGRLIGRRGGGLAIRRA
jgi:hypothetical protein